MGMREQAVSEFQKAADLQPRNPSIWKAADLTTVGTFDLGPGRIPYAACSEGIHFWITASTFQLKPQLSVTLAAREVSQWGGGARRGSEAPERDRAARRRSRGAGVSDGGTPCLPRGALVHSSRKPI
jgi:hypothetical protein